MMQFTYDKEANAAYIYFSEISENGVKKTVCVNDNVNLDFDSEGVLVGIEVLEARSMLSEKALAEAVVPR